MLSLTSRIWESTTGSRLFSRGSAAVLSSCGRDERTVAILHDGTEHNNDLLKNMYDLFVPQVKTIAIRSDYGADDQTNIANVDVKLFESQGHSLSVSEQRGTRSDTRALL